MSLSSRSFALHGIQISAELRYEHIVGLTYQLEGVVYSNPINDPSYVVMDTGDSYDTIPRVSMSDDPSGGCAGIRRSTYQHQITFAGPGIYHIHMIAGPRTTSVLLPGPNQQLCVTAIINISPLSGDNNSVIFQGAHIDRIFNTISHDPMATDNDGDNLTFEFIQPMGDECAPITAYTLPEAANFLWMDPATGAWIWDHPIEAGYYTFAIQATEWRDGAMVGRVVRDMTICLTNYEVGVSDIDDLSAITISPTLTDGPIRISTDLTRPTAFQIFDSSGRIHMQGTLQPGDQVIDLGNASAGVYHVRVNNEAVRVVKQ